MRRDPTEFRARFRAWKDGKDVYNAGRPIGYADGKDPYTDYRNFLAQYEGFRDTTYLDGKGIPTIGYGFTDPELVKRGRITREEADKYLDARIKKEEAALRDTLTNWDNLSTGAKTALISYRYNYPAGFKDTTNFMKYWNAGDYTNAIKEVDAGWNDTTNPGLRTRRMAEQALLTADPFLSGTIQEVDPVIKNDPVLDIPNHLDPVNTSRDATVVNNPVYEQINPYNYAETLSAIRQPMREAEARRDWADFQNKWSFKNRPGLELPSLFPLDTNEWTNTLIGYGGGKDDEESSEGFLNWLKNAVIGASVAEDPAVTAASGWHNEDGQWRQNRTKADEQLGNNLSVLSTFSPTHPLTAATEKALQVAGRALRFLRAPFVSELATMDKPVVSAENAAQEYTMAGGSERFQQMLYDNYLNGYEVPGLYPSIPRINRAVPAKMATIYKNSVEPRLVLQRPWMKPEEIQYGIDNALNEGYSVYDDVIFKRAGHPDWEAGFYSPKTGRISIRNNNERFAVGHEIRHRIDDKRVPLVEAEEDWLNASFTDDFKTLNKTVDDLKGVDMSEEMVTTNFDARKELLGEDILAEVSLPEQNVMIDKATDEQIIESMRNANGYGKHYVEALVKKYGKVPKKLIKAWRESYKYVGTTTGIAAASKNKQQK